MSVKVHLTYKCNSSCLYCTVHKEENVVLNPKKFYEILHANNIVMDLLYFTGGECTIFPETLKECLLISHNFGNENVLVTNGIKYFENDFIDKVMISIDGPFNVSNKYRYTKEIHENVLCNLNRYLNLYKTIIQCTLHSLNIKHYFTIKEFLNQYKVPVNYQLYSGKWFISPDDYIDVLKDIAVNCIPAKPCVLCKNYQICINPDSSIDIPCEIYIKNINKKCEVWENCDQVNCKMCNKFQKKLQILKKEIACAK